MQNEAGFSYVGYGNIDWIIYGVFELLVNDNRKTISDLNQSSFQDTHGCISLTIPALA